MNIDAHSHFVTEECLHALSKLEDVRNITRESSGPESGKWNIRLFERIKDKLSDIPTRLRDMDKARVDVQVLPPSPIMLYYWADSETDFALVNGRNIMSLEGFETPYTRAVRLPLRYSWLADKSDRSHAAFGKFFASVSRNWKPEKEQK